MSVVAPLARWTIERVVRDRPDECAECSHVAIRCAGLHPMRVDGRALCDSCASELDPLAFERLLQRRAAVLLTVRTR